jgi:selenoprotein W-related protein
LDEFEHQISEITLIPSAGGVFEVTVDGELISSKKTKGKFEENDSIATVIRDRFAR